MAEATAADLLMQFLPTMLVQLGLAPVVYNLAKRLRMRATIYLIASLIPIFGMFVIGIIQVRALFLIGRRLDEVEASTR